MSQPQPTRNFPSEDTLCESCGYPLKELPPVGDCPECGKPIADSDPKHRTGLPFEHSATVANYAKTAWLILRHPKHSARQLLIGKSNKDPLVFLFWNAVLCSVVWLIFYAVPLPGTFAGSWGIADRWDAIGFFYLISCATVPGILWLTAIEALGVAGFSRRRGWRVPFRLAQRVTCFASIGWVPGAAFLGIVMNMGRSGVIQDVWSAVGGPWANSADVSMTSALIAGVIAMLGFETLVWTGVRQVKYANTVPESP